MYGIAQPIAILVRMLAVLLLVYGTYNPSGYSYYHWVLQGGSDQIAVKAVVGMLMAASYAFCLNATFRSLRFLLGIPLVISIGTVVWLLSDWGYVDLSSHMQRTIILETSIAVVLGTGVSFSLIRYRLSGQMDSRTLV